MGSGLSAAVLCRLRVAAIRLLLRVIAAVCVVVLLAAVLLLTTLLLLPLLPPLRVLAPDESLSLEFFVLALLFLLGVFVLFLFNIGRSFILLFLLRLFLLVVFLFLLGL